MEEGQKQGSPEEGGEEEEEEDDGEEGEEEDEDGDDDENGGRRSSSLDDEASAGGGGGGEGEEATLPAHHQLNHLLHEVLPACYNLERADDFCMRFAAFNSRSARKVGGSVCRYVCLDGWMG